VNKKGGSINMSQSIGAGESRFPGERRWQGYWQCGTLGSISPGLLGVSKWSSSSDTYLSHPGPDPTVGLAQSLARLVLHPERAAGVGQGLGLPVQWGMRDFGQPELLCVYGPAPQHSRFPPACEMWGLWSKNIELLAIVHKYTAATCPLSSH
jgi:hypothetical protein